MPSLSRPRSAISAAFLANGLGFGAWAANVPLIQHRFVLTAPELGLLLLGLAGGSIAAMMLAGGIADRVGSMRVMRTSCLAFAVLLVLPVLAPSVAVLACCIVLIGVAAGSLDVTMNAQASEVERLGGRPMMSSFHAAFSIGGLVGAVCGSLFGLPWSALAVGGLALATLALGGVPDRAVPVGHAAPRLAFPGRSMLGICVLAGAGMMTEGAISDWSGIYLRDFAHASDRFVGVGYAAFALAMTAGRLGGDATLHRLGRTRAVGIGGLLAAAGLALALASPEPTIVAGGLFLVGIGLANVVPAAYSAGANSGAAQPATGIAMVATIGYGGLLLGPPVIGFIAGLVGLRAALGVVVVACLLVASLARLLR